MNRELETHHNVLQPPNIPAEVVHHQDLNDKLDQIVPISFEDFNFYVEDDAEGLSPDSEQPILPSEDGGLAPEEGDSEEALDEPHHEPTAAEKYANKALDELTDEEYTELFDETFGNFLELVRNSSQAGVMVSAAELDTVGLLPPHFTTEYFLQEAQGYFDNQELVSELEFDDITVLTGTSGSYYYSTRYMANNWAKGLFLAAEDDDLITFATIVRYESEIYPRPLIDFTLSNPPYEMTHERIEEAFRRAQETPGFDDLQEVFASNDDHYYYSNQHLSAAQAKALAEFYSVEQVRNV